MWECLLQTDRPDQFILFIVFHLYLSQTINNIQFALFPNILVYDLFYLIIERCDITWVRPLTFSQEVIYKRSPLVQQNFFCVRFWALKCPYTQIEFCFSIATHGSGVHWSHPWCIVVDASPCFWEYQWISVLCVVYRFCLLQ